MQNKLRYQQGISLVEMLVSLTISMIVLAAAVTMLTVNNRFGARQLQQDYLYSTLFSIANMIDNELTRAGFCFNCIHHNPFRTILIDDDATKLTGSCVRFAYNSNKSNSPYEIGKDDARGFRLGKNATGEPVIELYENYNGLSNWHCDKQAGYAGYWQDMMLGNIKLESFTISRALSVANNQIIQLFEIKIAASIKDDPQIKARIKFTINVPNG